MVLPLKRHLAPALLTGLPTLTVWLLPQGYPEEQVAGRESTALHHLLEAWRWWHYGVTEKGQQLSSVWSEHQHDILILPPLLVSYLALVSID